MAGTISVRLRSRSKKQGIKQLPESIELPLNASVEDAKKAIAKQAKVSDFNRLGLYDPTTNKTLKDRKALIKDCENVVSAGEMLVKDLGTQIAWRTVFVIEYLGPILFHVLFAAARQYIYPLTGTYPGAKVGDIPAMTTTQWACFALFLLHFLKREVETLFVHRFAANTMPAWNLFRNSALYWLGGGLLCSLVIYAPAGYQLLGFVPIFNIVREGLMPLDHLGIAIFTYGEVLNGVVHLHLASLRAPGTTGKGIPSCVGSSLVTCPNYMFEIIAWVGMIIVSRSWAVALTIFFGSLYMRMWSRGKEKELRQLFPDKYKKKRYTMLPGLV
ncbi:enoyl reductase TSC13 [Gaeumannomyces tritici R3-111a-1]|uniref:Enoyl reductase TSC13 n=1 Tax=Gaeumannomyces tritici (strain R3-111a-1) TaxID=644352 RepID=J3PCJ0_GAET3|nr:enoyl reductase TSC13 [Gaeumannomyces tritici R3-111a-1]EJT71960.1 enoyl reductase TSC13 [Gaeumannomyces tritici R3-111a-1]